MNWLYRNRGNGSLLRSLGKHRIHTCLVSKRIYLIRRLLEQMKWKEEMKVRSTNVESAPPRKKKFATLAHQLVSLSMKFIAQKREKKPKTSFFKRYKSYIYSVPLDSRVKLVQSCRVALSSGYLVRYFYFESELVNRINFMIHFEKLQSQNQNEWV